MSKTVPLEFDIFARDRSGPVFDKFGNRMRDSARDTNLLTSATKTLIGAAAGYIAFDKAADFIRGSVAEAQDAAKVGAQTAAVIKTTGGAAKVTAAEVATLAEQTSLKTGVDDEAIQTGSNLLLTFKQVRNEVGEGNKVFNRATVAAVDLSAAGFGSIESSSKMLGKALNDPLLGITALSRAGVTFTEQQKDQIKALVETGDLLSAQKMILQEVESQVSGSAEAQATSLDKLEVAWGNIKEQVGTELLPYLYDFADYVTKHGVPAAERFSGWLRDDGLPAGKEFAGWLKDEAIPAVGEFGEEMRPLAESILPAASTALNATKDAAVALAPAVKAIVDAFNSLPESVQTAVVLGGAATMLGSKLGVGLPVVGVGAGGGTKNKAGKGGKGGGGTSFLGTPALMAAAYTGMDLVGSIDTSRRALKGTDPLALAQTLDAQGNATAETVKRLKSVFESSNIGKYADDLSVDVDKLAESFAKNGMQGEYVQEVMSDLDDRYSTAKDMLGDAFGFILPDNESDKIGAFRASLNDAEEAMSAAGVEAQNLGQNQSDLGMLMGFSRDQAGGLQLTLDNLGQTHAAPEITMPNGGPVLAQAGSILSTVTQIPGFKRIVTEVTGYPDAYAKLSSLRSLVAQIPNMKHILTSVGVPAGALVPAKPKKDGGPITGPGGPRDDLVPIMASNGEHVWTTAEVNAAGGHAAVAAMRQAALHGVRRRDGGPVGTDTGRPGRGGFSEDALARAVGRGLRGTTMRVEGQRNLRATIEAGV